MDTPDIQASRIRKLNDKTPGTRGYVLYWMQQSQRAEWNHALEFAIEQANLHHDPVLVIFALDESYPEANLRHFTFLLQGLKETRECLEDRGIGMVITKGRPDRVALDYSRNASLVVCDRGFLAHQKRWRRQLAAQADVSVIEVESDTVVPVEAASEKAEYSARTIRPKLHGLLNEYLRRPHARLPKEESVDLAAPGITNEDFGTVLAGLKTDQRVRPVRRFKGGTSEARHSLDRFIKEVLPGYSEQRSRPELDCVSHLSPYLHFGQISALEVTIRAMETDAGSEADREAFIEELVVRRELAHNFVHYTANYDTFAALPAWSRSTLARHAGDIRPVLYTEEQLDSAATHDESWNAAMLEMKRTGFTHNYMRMYWGKKILEWSANPEVAFYTALRLNNRYFLDGRDPNSYANVAWLFGLHDRPWRECPVFGTVRSMSSAGLARKTDAARYIERVKRLIAEEEE